MRITLFLLGLLAAACAGKAIRMAPCPAEGGTPWYEARSPHFTVRTDLSAAEAREAATELEALRAAILAAEWPGLDPPQTSPLDVVALRSIDEFTMLVGENVRGFMAGSAWPLMALSGTPAQWRYGSDSAGTRPSIVAHELTHHISWLARLPQPPWLSEGLASFLETIQLSPDRSLVTIGRLNVPRLASFRGHRGFSVRDTLAGEAPIDHALETNAFYANSWLLVHWLYNTHSDGFVQYQGRLVEGEDEPTAWRRSFPDLDLATLDQQLFAYARKGDYGRYDMPLRFSLPAVTVSPLADAEVHATRAWLAVVATSRKERSDTSMLAAAELREALARDPDGLTALLLSAIQAKAPTERLALARRATAAHADSVHAWLFLASALDETAAAIAERERAYARVLELAPREPAALNNLADLYLSQGRAQQALPLSQLAVEVAPDATTLLTHAKALAGTGHCAEAMPFHERAAALQSLLDPEERKSHGKSLAEVRRRCEPPAPSAHSR